MYKSKPISILKTFTNKELKKLGEYIASPFFNKNQAVIDLFLLLKKYHPDYEGIGLQREKVFRKLFGKSKYEEQKLRYLMSDLTKLMEGFLIHEHFTQNQHSCAHSLLEIYTQRKLEKYFQTTLQNYQNQLDNNAIKNIKHYLNAYQIDEAKFIFHSSLSNRPNGTDIKGILDNLDIFYIANKLKYSSELYNAQNILSLDFDTPLLLNEIRQKFEAEDHLHQEPVIAIYHQILLTLLERETIQHYDQLILLLEQYAEHFEHSELQDMYIFARNYCYRRYMGGDREYLRKSFELHEILLENNVLLFDGQISQWDFKNIVSVGLVFGKNDFVEKFIFDYKKYLKPSVRENAFTYNLAYLRFYQKDYDSAIRLLHNVEFTDPYYHIDTKVLLMRCYYELEEVIPLFNLIDTIRAYIRRNKQISKGNKNNYLNFFKFVKKLVRIKMGSKKTIEDLKEEIDQTPNFDGSSWLYEKIKELELNPKRW
ncbi:MAG: hypothetical protein R3E32_03520 [Chitinophagales bacterium]